MFLYFGEEQNVQVFWVFMYFCEDWNGCSYCYQNINGDNKIDNYNFFVFVFCGLLFGC